jgi:4'-phosphopantetheinyl transferase EntD
VNSEAPAAGWTFELPRPPRFRGFEDILSRFFGPSARVAIGHIAEEQRPLFLEESRMVSRAAPKRVAEFTAGRTLARRAAAGLGHGAQPLLADRAGCPKWPRGLIGSISHSGPICIAVACPTDHAKGVGIDVETSFLSEGAHGYICTPQELARVKASNSRDHLVQLIFSAKESFFKCHYQATGKTVGFQDLEFTSVEHDGSTGLFDIHLSDDATDDPALSLPGLWLRHGDMVVTAVLLAQGSPGRLGLA